MMIRVQQMPHASGLPLPARATAASAGYDVVAAVDAIAPKTLPPGEWALIPTGLILEIPDGHEVQVRPRSGLALKHGVTVLNAPGTIDADYRGEVGVVLINHGREPFVIERGMRIAQLVFARALAADFVIEADLQITARGAGGFGSTGG